MPVPQPSANSLTILLRYLLLLSLLDTTLTIQGWTSNDWFEPRTSGIGSERSTSWATTTAPKAISSRCLWLHDFVLDDFCVLICLRTRFHGSSKVGRSYANRSSSSSSLSCFLFDRWMDGRDRESEKKQFGASQIRQQVAGDHAEFHSKMITGWGRRRRTAAAAARRWICFHLVLFCLKLLSWWGSFLLSKTYICFF